MKQSLKNQLKIVSKKYLEVAGKSVAIAIAAGVVSTLVVPTAVVVGWFVWMQVQFYWNLLP